MAEQATAVVRLEVEEGALVRVPVYERHSRGKNWLAVIAADPTGPGGLGRTFIRQGRGRYYYLTDGLAPGQPVEFGADYYTGGGRPHRTRWYGVVRSVSAEAVEVEQAPTAAAALKIAEQPAGAGERLAALEAERSSLLGRLAALDQELAALQGATA